MNNIKKSLLYLKGYEQKVILKMLVTIVVSFLEIFSLISIMPLLNVLFNIQEKSEILKKPDSIHLFPLNELVNSIKLNVQYAINNIVLEHEKGKILLILCVGLFLLITLKNIFVYVELILEGRIRNGIDRDAKKRIYTRVLELPIHQLNNQRKGDILTRFTKDVEFFQHSVLSGLKIIFKQPIMIFFYLIAMIAISPQLTLFVFVLIPPLGFVISKISKSLKKNSHRAQEQSGELLSQLDETISGSKVIKAFTAESFLSHQFSMVNEKLRATKNKIDNRRRAASPVSETLGVGLVMIVLWYGGTLILKENSALSAGSFITFIVIFSRLISPLKSFSELSSDLAVGMASAERIDEFLDKESEFSSEERTKIEFKNQIEFKDISFRYPDSELDVIKNFNLNLQKGKTIALVGESGAGKSTIADLTSRFYEPSLGSIYIDGKPIQEYSKYQLRGLIAYVSQEAVLFNTTILNNISFGVENVTKEQIIEAAKVANAHEFIIEQENGYDTIVGERGANLSGGQRQRITIARAILKNAPILILDEATSALDSESEKLVQEAIDILLKDRTALVIAHRLSTIKNAHQICVMQDGKIVEQGTHQELLNSGGYYKTLTEMQSL